MSELIPIILVAIALPFSIWLLLPHMQQLNPDLTRDLDAFCRRDWRALMSTYRCRMAYG
jgi:hypothetical protein